VEDRTVEGSSGTRRFGAASVSGLKSGRKAKSIVELSLTVLRVRLVLKWRTGSGEVGAEALGRFDSEFMAVLKL